MTPLELIELAAATWYIAYVVSSSHGPFGAFEWLRAKLPLGGLTACIICLSIWVSLALVLITGHTVLDAVAVAGVALLAHGFTGWRINI